MKLSFQKLDYNEYDKKWEKPLNAYHVRIVSGYDNELGSRVDAVKVAEYIAGK